MRIKSSTEYVAKNETDHTSGYKAATFWQLQEEKKYLLEKKLNTYWGRAVRDLVLSLTIYLHGEDLNFFCESCSRRAFLGVLNWKQDVLIINLFCELRILHVTQNSNNYCTSPIYQEGVVLDIFDRKYLQRITVSLSFYEKPERRFDVIIVENDEDNIGIPTSSRCYIPVWFAKELCFIRVPSLQIHLCSLKARYLEVSESSHENNNKENGCI